MKRFLKHFFQTMMMVAAVGLFAVLPNDPSLKYATLAVWCLVGCLLMGICIYLYHGHKKGLFCLILIGLILGITQNALADFASDREKYRSEVLKYCNKSALCKAAEDDADRLYKLWQEGRDIEGGTSYDSYIQAVSCIEAWDRAVKAGAYDSWYVWDPAEKDAKDCAEKYTKAFAEFLEKIAEAKLRTVKDYLETERSSCWPCGIAHLLITATEKVCLAVEDIFKEAALQLLGIMLLFWLMIRVLVLIGGFGTASNADFFTDILKRCVIAMIAATFLSFPMMELYNLTISPLVEATAGLTRRIVELSGVGGLSGQADDSEKRGIGAQVLSSGSLLEASCDCCTDAERDKAVSADKELEQSRKNYTGGSDPWVDKNISDCNSGTLGSKINGVLTLNAKRELMCMTCGIYKQTAPFAAAGRVLTYGANHGGGVIQYLIRKLGDIVGSSILSHWPYTVGMWFTGVLLSVLFMLLAASVAFRIIDVFIRMGFAIIVTPFLVTAFVFPISRQYTQRGWEFLVHALLSLLGLAIATAIILSMMMTTLPDSVTNNLTYIMSQTKGGNTYACNLYAAWLGIAYNGKCSPENLSGSYFPLFFMIIIIFLGMHILKASTAIMEGLTGISCGIPSIAGAAVMGAIKTTLAPVKMAFSVAAERISSVKSPDKSTAGNDSGENKGIFAKLSKFAEDKAVGLDHVGENAGKGVEAAGKSMEAAGKAMEKGGKAAGEVMDKGGKATAGAGKGIMGAGKGLSATGLGAIIGVPLIIVGAAVAGAGLAAQGVGKATKAGSKLAGMATKFTGKIAKTTGVVTQKVGRGMSNVGKVVNRGGRLAARGMRAVSRGAARMQRGVDRLKAVPRKIRNRMKQLPVVKNIRNMRARSIKRKRLRAQKAGKKYIRKKPASDKTKPGKPGKGRELLVNMLDKANAGIDRMTGSGDNAFGDGATGGYAGSAAANSGAPTDLGWKPPK